MCVYFVFVLGMESRAFMMLKAGYAPKIKAECLSWLRPQPPSPSSYHHIMNSLSWKIARASSFDGGASEMVRKCECAPIGAVLLMSLVALLI